MPSTKEYLSFILEQLSDLDEITHKAMMGEYILYYRGRIFGGVYDDRFLVKPVKFLFPCNNVGRNMRRLYGTNGAEYIRLVQPYSFYGSYYSLYLAGRKLHGNERIYDRYAFIGSVACFQTA